MEGRRNCTIFSGKGEPSPARSFCVLLCGLPLIGRDCLRLFATRSESLTRPSTITEQLSKTVRGKKGSSEPFGGLDNLSLSWSIPYIGGLMSLTLAKFHDIRTRGHSSASRGPPPDAVTHAARLCEQATALILRKEAAMKKPIRCALTVFACVLAGGWLLATPGVASAGTADFPNGSRNMELVGAGLQGVPLSKLAPWPRTDGRYFYSGGYQQTEGSFWVIDVKDHENPVGYETPAYDKILSPAPPRPHPIWNSPAFDYTNDPYNPATGVGLKSPCGDWIPYWKSLAGC